MKSFFKLLNKSLSVPVWLFAALGLLFPIAAILYGNVLMNALGVCITETEAGRQYLHFCSPWD